MELLVIDEVSAFHVDAMDYMMQTVQEYESFGGVQVVYW
jgi:hypothetical protein